MTKLAQEWRHRKLIGPSDNEPHWPFSLDVPASKGAKNDLGMVKERLGRELGKDFQP